VFDEPLDSLKATTVNSYSTSDGIGNPRNVIVQSPLFDRVILKLNQPLLLQKIYNVNVANVTDCSGNRIDDKSSVRVALPVMADSFDIVINEVLFNPIANGVDYVEMYNRSAHILNLKNIYIANRNTAGLISSITQLSAEDYLFFPGDYMVATTDVSIVKRDYITLNPSAFTELTSMPSFNDDKGDVVILNAQGKIMDELAYTDKWHFKLIDNAEGVALERVDYNGLTQQPDNWHSAAGSAGYGTPGYKNSQFYPDQQLPGEINVSPGVFSPDNDGFDDFATIEYSFPSPGYVANITVFDAGGRVVRLLQQNALCGIKGNYRWDGLGEKNQLLPSGIYIIYTEAFNLKGKKKHFKNVIVLARKN
jgi:Lamin Tail Domain